MGMMSRLMKSLGRFWGSTLDHPASWFVDWIRGGETNDSGVTVNGKTALEYAPVWYGVNKISGHVGQLPLSVYEKVNDRERIERPAHPGSWVINNPLPYMDPMVFRESLQAHALLWGNGRAAIVRNGRNDPAELIPLLPDRTVTVLVNGEKWHVVTDNSSGEKTKLRDRDVLHIVGFGFDGIQGYSLIHQARNSWGLGLAAEKHTNRHFKSNAIPGLVIEAPPGAFRNDGEAKKFLQDWNNYHEGVQNSNKAALMQAGMKVNTLGMNGRDAQWIEQRRFQRQEAALWLLLEQILGDDSSVSYNSLEMKNLAYLSVCLNRWLIKWEQQCDRKLLTTQQRESGKFYFKFVRNALLQVTTKERFEIYEKGRTIGVYSPNDVREMEDLPPRKDPEGDRYDNPNTTPGGPTEKPPATKDEPPADPKPKPSEPPDDRLRLVIETRLAGLMTVEAHRVVEAAEKQKNFVAWLDGFYGDDGFAPRLAEVWQQCGGTTEQMLAYANESKGQLLAIAGNVGTQAELVASVANLTESWPARAALQTSLILSRKESTNE